LAQFTSGYGRLNTGKSCSFWGLRVCPYLPTLVQCFNDGIFDALEWLAAMCSHVPNKGEQMVRYYGYYSNVSRGNRKKQNQDEWIPCILESDESSKERRKNWARLIQKIYEVDPLTCPKCSAKMKVISVIEDQDVIKKILKHLGLWEVKPRPPPRMAKSQPLSTEPHIDYSHRGVGPYGPEGVKQVPPSDDILYHLAFTNNSR
jgi:hypothetical protein